MSSTRGDRQSGETPGMIPAAKAKLLDGKSAAERFIWRRPVGFDVKSCGQPDLHWDLSNQKILVCYEMAQDLANLYRGYGLANVMKPDTDSQAKGTKATKK